jgi:hypothetical protein
MDWEQFMNGLSHRDRLVIEFMLEGKSLRDAGHEVERFHYARHQAQPGQSHSGVHGREHPD